MSKAILNGYKELYNLHFKIYGMPEYEVLTKEERCQIVNYLGEGYKEKFILQQQLAYKYSGIILNPKPTFIEVVIQEMKANKWFRWVFLFWLIAGYPIVYLIVNYLKK